jgi:uncharacterized protein (TIGR03086 family)
MPFPAGPAPTALVVGGGPGGLMAAEVLAGAGLSVTVVEHRRSVGRKLLLAGRGGLNLTHTEPLGDLLARYGDPAPQLRAAVEGFGPDDLRAWAEGLGQATFVGTSGRVFPEAFRATPLLRAWLARLGALGVSLRTETSWLGWDDDDPDGSVGEGHRVVVSGADGKREVLTADVVVLALGGASWPRTGSDGGWLEVVEAAGIQVRPLRASNVGVKVAWSPTFADRFAGEPLKDVRVAVAPEHDHAAAWSRGDVVATRTGLEGGPVYALSPGVRRALDDDGTARLLVDLLPDLSPAAVAARWARRRPKDSLASNLRRTLGLTPVAVGLLREATGNRVPTDGHELAALVTAIPLTVTATEPVDRAISTAGGIAFDEVDEHFMLRRRPGTFVVGEMLDWDAPTGGYLLQATFSTAVAAARGALAVLDVLDAPVVPGAVDAEAPVGEAGGMSETADRYRRLSAQFAERIAGVPDTAWDDPTPCEEWTVRALVRHVVDSQGIFLDRVGIAAPVVDVAADPEGAWRTTSATVQAELDDPERAAAPFEGFMGPTTLEESIDRFVVLDLIAHGWDLARATGQDERIDPDDLSRLDRGARSFGEIARSPGVFGEEIPVGDDADDQTRVLAYIGRRA